MIGIKNDNQRVVLNLIRKNREISGAELSRITGQRRSSLAYTLKGLQDLGIIEISRIGESTSSGGKPPTLWKLTPNSGFFIGVEVTPFEIRTVVTDFASTVLYKDIHKNLDSLEDLKGLADFIDSRVEALNLERDKIIGVGLAVPGMVDPDSGTGVIYSTTGAKSIDLKKPLTNELGLNVEIINDANAGALGEKWFSSLPETLNNMVFLSINEDHAGIGAGFILNGQLYKGITGSAGEFLPFGMKLKYIFDKLETEEDFTNYSDISKVYKLYLEGSSLAKDILVKITDLLSMEIARLVTLINPETIIIGGDFSITKEFIKDSLDRRVKEHYEVHYPIGIKHPYLEFSKQGIFSGAIGATAIFIDSIFNPLGSK